MGERKSYSAAKYAEGNKEWPFAIDGEIFTAYPARVPATTILDSNSIVEEIERGTNSTREFFQAVLTDEGYQQFHKYLREHKIPAGLLRDLATDIMEQSAGRPTEQSSS